MQQTRIGWFPFTNRWRCAAAHLSCAGRCGPAGGQSGEQLPPPCVQTPAAADGLHGAGVLRGWVLVGAPIPLALGFALLGVVVLGPDRSGRAHALCRRGPDGAVSEPRPGLPMVFSAVAVASAGGIGELVGCHRRPGLGAAMYCGAFAGMTSEQVLPHPGWVLMAGALAGLLLNLLQSSWAGIAGKLGSTAFLAVFGIVGLTFALRFQGPGEQLHRYTDLERVLLMLMALLSSQLTHWLSYPRRIGAVLGSALPSLLAGLLLPAPLATAWMGGSFVGMTAPDRLCAKAAMSVFAVLGLRRLLASWMRPPHPVLVLVYASGVVHGCPFLPPLSAGGPGFQARSPG